MFDFLPTKILPPALLGGVLIYGLVCLVWLQPLVESRLAELTYIPQCETDLHKAEAAAPVPDNPRRRELELLIDMYEKTNLDQLPFVSEALEFAKRELAAMQPKRLRTSRIELNGICSCSVDKVFADHHLKMTLAVASLRTHVPAFLKSMNRNVLAIAASGTCGSMKG